MLVFWGTSGIVSAAVCGKKSTLVFPELVLHSTLVGGFNPLEKYDRQIGFIFPKFSG